MNTFIIDNLYVKIDGKDVVNGVSLDIKSGEIHVIMGPNGAGKSTLAAAIMGDPKYKEVSGNVFLNAENILNLAVDERAKRGFFLAMQYPVEIPGVTNSDFLRTAKRAITNQNISIFDFALAYDKEIKELNMSADLAHRYLNEGFSGGEKKRNEILQMEVLKPKFAILDEIDSGLDVDALKTVGNKIKQMVSNGLGVIIITHYVRILDIVTPNYVHIMNGGQIIKTGGVELIKKIDLQGYQWLNSDVSN